MNEKLKEILSDVWHRSISADEGFDAIFDLIEQSAEIARLEAELAEYAARYRWLCENNLVNWSQITGFYFDADTGIDDAIDEAMKGE